MLGLSVNTSVVAADVCEGLFHLTTKLVTAIAPDSLTNCVILRVAA